MASTYSGGVSIELIGAGDQAGTWGTTTNENWKRIEQSVSTYSTVSLSGQSSPYDWTLSNTASAGAANTEGRSAFVEFTNAASALTINIRGASASDYPNRVFFVLNSSGYDLTFDCNSSTDFVLKNGYGAAVYTNPGTAVGNVFNTLQVGSGASGILIKDGYVEASGGTLNLGSSAVTTSGNITTTGSGALNATTVDATNVKVTNIKAKDNSSSATIADSTGVMTIASSVLTTTDINGGTIDGTNITVGSGKTLDVQSGTLTLANDQISGDKINGGTIGSTTITDLASTTVESTNVRVTNIKAKDNTNSATIADSTGVMTILSSVLTTTNIDGGTIDGTTIAGSPISGSTGSFTTLEATSTINLNGASTCSASSSATTLGCPILIGPDAGDSLTSASAGGTIAIGDNAGTALTQGHSTIAIGTKAVKSSTTQSGNIGIGYESVGGGQETATGQTNVGIGYHALRLTTNTNNVALGAYAGQYNSTGENNTFLGYANGYVNGGTTALTGDYNVAIGALCGFEDATTTRSIAIGKDVDSATDKVRIGSAASTYIEASYTSGTWTDASDRRVKKDIENSDIGLDFINALRPVSFKFKQPEDIVGNEDLAVRDFISKVDEDGNETVTKTAEIQRGFIAQEVKEAIDSLGLDGEGLGWSESSSGFQRVGNGDFVPALVAAVQELSQKVKDLEDRLSD